jgi:hypothetical protein
MSIGHRVACHTAIPNSADSNVTQVDTKRMSALGQKQTLDWWPLMSALPPKADIG